MANITPNFFVVKSLAMPRLATKLPRL